MDVEQLQDAVDRARLKMWTELGIQLGLDFTGPFTEYLAEEMGMNAPQVGGPQPAIEIVSVNAEIKPEPTYTLHEFKPDRGGKLCITCDMTEKNGYHSTSKD